MTFYGTTATAPVSSCQEVHDEFFETAQVIAHRRWPYKFVSTKPGIDRARGLPAILATGAGVNTR